MSLEMRSVHLILRQTQCLTLPPSGHVIIFSCVDHYSAWLRFPFSSCLDLESSLLYPANGSQLEIHLVHVAVPALPSIPCDVSPLFLDLPVVMCRTRYTCPGMERSDRTSAWLFSVVFGGKLEPCLLWL